ncbi:MAG: cytochrome b5 domain-containing protein [Candidatus Nanopelagicales bacterium]
MRLIAKATAAGVLVLLLGACGSGSGDTAAESPADSPTAAESPTAADSPTTTSATTYSMDDVAAHASQTDCWAAIGGKVYDLTKWISQHPGGPDKIIPLCGTDATSAFTGQHDSQAAPNGRLEGFQVGVLG